MMKRNFALCAMLLSFASVMAFGQQVSVNYNHSQDFTQFHTYAWENNNPNQVANSILAQAALSDIDTALQGKGLSMVDMTANPDLILLVSGGLQQQTSYSAWGMRGFGGGMGGITPQQNVVGTLVVDLYDAKNKQLVWRGLGQNTLSSNGSKNQQTVDNAVKKMFKQYP
jgi:Domain of unknown function (DUF4136)